MTIVIIVEIYPQILFIFGRVVAVCKDCEEYHAVDGVQFA